MNKPILTILSLYTATVFVACHQPQVQRQHIPSEVSTTAPTEGRPTLAMPVQLPDSDVFITPFTIDRPKRWLEDADRFETARKSEAPRSSVHYEVEAFGNIGQSRSVRWHNAVVGKRGGEGKLVLNQRGMISKLEIVGPWIEANKDTRAKDEPIEWKFVPKAVLFLATVEDTDGDGQLTSQDASVLLAAGPDAAGLHPITPAKTQVWSTRYNADQNLIMIMVAGDTNGDGLFSAGDSAAPYVYTPGDAGPAMPLVDPKLVEQAERLLK